MKMLAPKLLVQKQGGKDQKVKIIVVGGGLRGPALLDETLKLCRCSSSQAEVVGVVADNAHLKVPGWRVRYTWYEQFQPYQDSMREDAILRNLPCYYDDVSRQNKQDKYGFSLFEQWLYQDALGRELGDKRNLKLLFLMACFGQRWGKSTINLADGWFINTHPVAHGTVWDKNNPYRGPVPYEKMCRDKVTECDLVAHIIDNTWDGGSEVDRVGPYPLIPCTGRKMYYRRVDGQMVRSGTQGEFVIGMHQRMADPTRLLIKKIFPGVISEIQSGHWPSKKVLKRLKKTSVEAV